MVKALHFRRAVHFLVGMLPSLVADWALLFGDQLISPLLPMQYFTRAHSFHVEDCCSVIWNAEILLLKLSKACIVSVVSALVPVRFTVDAVDAMCTWTSRKSRTGCLSLVALGQQ